MSERQAKLKRKNEVKETQKKKKSAVEIVSNIIIVLLVLAVVGVGGWAVWPKVSQMTQNNQTDNQVTVPTVAEYVATEGTTLEQFIADFGLTDAEITAETPITAVIPNMTLANYAKFSETDVETAKQTLGVEGDYTEETLMSEIIADIDAKAAAEAENEAPAEETAE